MQQLAPRLKKMLALLGSLNELLRRYLTYWIPMYTAIM